MRLCVGTSKGIVIIDPARGATPLMVLADPSPVWCMAQDCADPGCIYAASNDVIAHGRAVFARSEDGGRSWAEMPPRNAHDEEIWAMTASPEVKDQVFIGTSHGRILRSDDRGRNFQELTAFLKVAGRDRWSFPPPPHIPHVRSIAFDPSHPAIVYAGVEEGGIFRTQDAGLSFESLNSGLYDDVHTVAVDPNDSRRLYATTGRGFYVSSNAGSSWRHVTAGFNRTYTVPLLVTGGDHPAIHTVAAADPPPMWRVGARGADSVMFRSDDRGESFYEVERGASVQRGMLMRFRMAPGDDGDFFGVSDDGTLVHANANGDEARPEIIAEKLPPAYDLVVLP
jgi:photosystem II stability/assembly factor-like uncharacterized protein